MDIKKEAVSLVLDGLIGLGRKKLRNTKEAAPVIEILENKFGLTVDSKMSADKALAIVRPLLVTELDEVQNRIVDHTLESIQAMEPTVAKKTFLDIYVDLPRVGQIMFMFMCCLGLLGHVFVSYYVWTMEPFDPILGLLTIAFPSFAVVGLGILPIKTVAFAVVDAGSASLRYAMRKK